MPLLNVTSCTGIGPAGARAGNGASHDRAIGDPDFGIPGLSVGLALAYLANNENGRYDPHPGRGHQATVAIFHLGTAGGLDTVG
jgi:hypothetical protein